MKPFLKWVGSKTHLSPIINSLIPPDTRRYHEPMLGSGAVFLGLEREFDEYYLSDLNHRLIGMYEQLVLQPEALISELERRVPLHSTEYYLLSRVILNYDTAPPLEQAARFLYLNRACYRGLYRENRKGGFNAPWGGYREIKFDYEALRKASAKLASARIECSSYESTLEQAGTGDFIYLDPPYDNTYSGYTKEGAIDHTRMATLIHQAAAAGAIILLSSSDYPPIRRLYPNDTIIEVAVPRSISKSDRTRASELLITIKGAKT